jgi:basic membrane protein A and related proteins
VGPDLRSVIVTSMIKRVDNAVFAFVKSEAGGHFRGGIHRYDLADDGLSYATSGGAIDALVPELNAVRQKIIDGVIKVPIRP